MQFHDFLNKILGDSAKIKAIKLLIKQPEGISGRELGRLIGVSHFKSHAVLTELAKQGILTVRKAGKANIYQLNRRHLIIEKLRPIFRLEEDFFTVVGDYLFSKLKPNPLSIILYGSIARNEERPDSDIDILVIYKDGVFRPDFTDKILEKGADMPLKFGNRLSVIAVQLSKFQSGVKSKDPLFYRIFKEGRVIAGLSINEVLGYDRT